MNDVDGKVGQSLILALLGLGAGVAAFYLDKQDAASENFLVWACVALLGTFFTASIV